MINRQQMELHFEARENFHPVIRRQRRLARAHWWFTQMRQCVDKVLVWQPAPPARPEQTKLHLANDR